MDDSGKYVSQIVLPPLIISVDNDFFADNDKLIELSESKTKEYACISIFFYLGNSESKGEYETILAAMKDVGRLFGLGVCDLSQNPKVFARFQKLQLNSDQLYTKFGLQGIPFLLTYRDGIPKALYGGAYLTDLLVNYLSVQACQASNTNTTVKVTGVSTNTEVGGVYSSENVDGRRIFPNEYVTTKTSAAEVQKVKDDRKKGISVTTPTPFTEAIDKARSGVIGVPVKYT